MRKAIVGVGILLIILLLGLLAAPHLVDIERLKEPLARELALQIRRPVLIAGRLGFSLLPVPSLTARDVRVANPEGAIVSDMVRLRALEVKLAFWPLLAGRFEIRSARLVEPEIDVERVAGGALNWSALAAGIEEHGERTGEPGHSIALSFDRISIQNGAVTYRSGAWVERFEHISTEVGTEVSTGTLGVSGQLIMHGAAVNFSLRCGRLDAAEIPIQLTATTAPATQLQFDALIAGQLGGRRMDGKVKLTTGDAQALLARSARFSLPPALAQAAVLTAQLSGTAEAVTLDPLTIEIGPARGDGRSRVRLDETPEIAVSLSFARIDLDHWPAPRQAGAPELVWPISRAFAAEPAASGPRGDWPAGIAGNIELGIEALIWRGGLVQDARLKAALGAGHWRIERLGGALPGGSEIALSGEGFVDAEGAHGTGAVEVSSDNLRQIAAWLGAHLDAVPPDRLRKASISSRFAVSGDRLDLEALDATLDASRLTGAATVLLRSRPGIGLRLETDRLNLDAYWPHSLADRDLVGAGNLAPFDLNLDARFAALTWRGQPMTDVHLAGLLRAGEITVRELAIGDVGGAAAKFTGVIEGLGAGPPRGQLAFDMHGAEFERLLRLAIPTLVAGRRYGAFSLGGGLQSDGASISLDAELEALDAHIHASGEVALPAGSIDMALDLDHPDLAQFMHALSPSYQMAGKPGPLKLTGHAKGDLTKFKIDGFTMAVGEQHVAGTIAVDRTAAKPRLAAEFEAGDWRIDPFLPVRQTALRDRAFRGLGSPPTVLRVAAAADSAPSAAPELEMADVELKLAAASLALADWRVDQPALAVSLNDGVVSLTRLDGRLFAGTLAAAGRFVAPDHLDAHLSLSDADLNAVLQHAVGVSAVDGRVDIDAALGCEHGCMDNFAARLTGDATVQGRDGSLKGIDIKALNDRLDHPVDVVALVRAGAGGRTAFRTLDGRFHLADGAAASDDLRLRVEGGEVGAMVRVEWPQRLLTSRLELHLAALPSAPPVIIRLDGPVTAPRVLLDANAFEQYLNQNRGSPSAAPARQP